MERKALIRELQQVLNELAIFNEIAKTLTSTLKLSDILEIIFTKTEDLLSPSGSALYLSRGSNGTYTRVLYKRGKTPLPKTFYAGDSTREGKAVLSKTPNITTKKLMVPLISKSKVWGMLSLIGKRNSTFTTEDLAILSTLADYAAIAIENANYLDQVKELTLIDDLTGLYNWRYLHQRLDAYTRKKDKTPLSIIFLDIDNFKNVNDKHGHLHGSNLLHEIALFLKANLPKNSETVRYGGDEFLVLLPGKTKSPAITITKKLISKLRKHVFLKSLKEGISITASFGIATYPSDTNNGMNLIQLADKAMYKVKYSTKNDWCATQ